jgi:uncharacterized protein YjbI with pentapeptide repeats
MAARRRDRDRSPVVPELQLVDLAEAEALVAGARNELLHVTGDLAAGRNLAGTTFLEVHWDDAVLAGTDLTEARFVETRFSGLDEARLNAPTSAWREAELVASRIGAAELDGADLHAVLIADCRIGYLNLRQSTCRDLLVRDSQVDDLDLAGASVERARFERCRIGHLMLGSARLSGVDLRGSRVDRFSSVAGLAGAAIDAEQLVQLAPALAAHLGIEVG